MIQFSNDSIFTRIRDTASDDQLYNCDSRNYSFTNLLANFTNICDVTIYITTDIALSSVMQLTRIENIAIIGYNNPTVQCDYSGELHFVSCHNVTIDGIIWNECGANTNVNYMKGIGLYMYNSSDIIFQNCIFQNSLSQSIVLSEMSGSVNINNCNFTHNNNKNHGTAIHYSSKLSDV